MNRWRFVLWGLFLGLLTLILIYFSLAGGDTSQNIRNVNSHVLDGRASKSAYGYQGLVRWLREAGKGGRIIEGASPIGGKVGLRILVEPDLKQRHSDARRAFKDFLTASRVPVLVIPSVRSTARLMNRLDRRGFAKEILEKNPSRINQDIGFRRTVKKAEGHSTARVSGSDLSLFDLLYFDDVEPGLRSWEFEAGSFLVREKIAGTELFFLSDPDLFNNAGLARADNADFLLSFIEEVAGSKAVIFDQREVRMGEPSGFTILGRLLERPLFLVTGSVTAFLVLLLWMALGRFGPIAREQKHLDAGKETAIEAAVLMLSGKGNNREVLQRYFISQTRQLTHALGGPKTADLGQRLQWLSNVGKRRGVPDDLDLKAVQSSLFGTEGTLSEGQAANFALTIHAFRRAILNDA